MITTIKVTKTTKHALNQVKKASQTYDELISELVDYKKKESLREQLKEGYLNQDQKEYTDWESFDL